MFAYIQPVRRELGRVGAVGDLGLVLLGLVQVAVVIGALVSAPRQPVRLAHVLGVACVGCLVLLLLGQPPGPWQVTWWPTTAFNAVFCFLLVFGGRWRWLSGATLMVAALGVRLMATAASGESLRLGVAEGVSGLQLAWTVVLAVEALRRVGLATEASLDERRRVLITEQLERAQDRQNRAVERFLHDEVLHALRAVSRPRLAGAEAVRDLVNRTVTLLGQSRDRAEHALADRIETLRAEVAITIEVSGRPPNDLPAAVEGALGTAVTEAIRNADQHSGADRVRVRWLTAGRRVEVEVQDSGRGFDTAGITVGGTRDSIAQAMEDVGGWSEIRSSSAGTLVRVGWRGHSRGAAVLRDTWRELRRGTVIASIPILVGNVCMFTLLLPELGAWASAAVAVVVACLIGLWAGIKVWHDQPGPAVAILVPLGSVTALFLNVASIPQDLGNGFYYFMAGGVVPLLMPLVVAYPLVIGLVQVAVVWLGLVLAGAWRFGLARTLTDYAGAVTAPTLLVAILILRLVVTVLGRRSLAELGRLDESEIRTRELEVRNAVTEGRLRRVAERVGPFLDEVGAGRLALDDPQVGRRARQFELEVRDEVHFGGPPPELAERLAAVRERGWWLELRVDRGDVVAQQSGLLSLVEAFDQEPWSDDRVVVSNLGELVAVLPGPWRGRQPEGGRVQLETGDGYTRLLSCPPNR
ncbi:hypothetical protein CGZ93_13475 [Enemella dayhoffiae]|uniref:Histidine kinase/HSP90-like ATPase domain-containing protein n=2 Tax=Enemella dayhoffiae TaxID=2016507 RepID=A0A255GV91_9ACTN|nr:hypothetical protein CGZ93_13475 [Enemella dayhoffiae]